MTQETAELKCAKQAAGKAALQYVEEGMIIGLGTGSTAHYFIEALAEKCKMGLKIRALATSKQSHALALKLGIPLIQSTSIEQIDLTVDGADEINSYKQMIKGGGGALFREKLIAKTSKKLIIIVDETKLVKYLGNFPVAIEILPFLHQHTLMILRNKEYFGKLRLLENQTPFMTDNGNYIFDCQFTQPILDVVIEHEKLKLITGVLETGLFSVNVEKVIIGKKEGTIEITDD